MPIMPLAVPVQCRSKSSLSTLKDSFSKNVYFSSFDDKQAVVKRPGLKLILSQAGGFPQGLFSIGPNNHPLKVDTAAIRDAVTNAYYGPAGGSLPCTFSTTEGAGGTFLYPLVFINEGNHLNTVNTLTGVVTVVTTASTAPSLPQYVPGVVCLNSTTYVLDADGKLYNSAVGDCYTWNALNFVKVNQDDTKPKALARHLNYIIGFTEQSGVVYVDVGNAVGSTLQRYDSACFSIGCSAGFTVASFEQGLIWVGKRADANNSVWILNGLTPQKISTEHIDKFFENNGLAVSGVFQPSAYITKFRGHEFYVLHLPTPDITLVYDIVNKTWHVWSSNRILGIEGIFDGVFCCESRYQDSEAYMMGKEGSIYQLHEGTYQDEEINNRNINVLVQTSRLDLGTQKRKIFNSVNLLADADNTTVALSYTDNDYTSFSTPRNFTLSQDRPAIFALGMGRKRAFRFAHTDNTPLRLYGAEFDISPTVN